MVMPKQHEHMQGGGDEETDETAWVFSIIKDEINGYKDGARNCWEIPVIPAVVPRSVTMGARDTRGEHQESFGLGLLIISCPFYGPFQKQTARQR